MCTILQISEYTSFVLQGDERNNSKDEEGKDASEDEDKKRKHRKDDFVPESPIAKRAPRCAKPTLLDLRRLF